MIRRKNEYTQDVRTNMMGGDGSVTIEHIFKKGEGLDSNIRMYSRITIQPGCSIGKHTHQGEEEILHVISGKGLADDNGTEILLEAGDSIVTRSGEFHGIACAGDEPLVLLAAIPVY